MRLSEIAVVVGGELIGLDADVGSFSSDTRTLQTNDVFIALSGPNFNANALVHQAAEKGAVAAVVSRMDPNAGIPQIIVADCHQALGQIAAAWRARFPSLVRVAMTGSAGKTSTKEMTARIFEQQGETLATLGNLNNDIGVPLTLLRLRDEHQFGVFELGANHAGEIAYTSGLVQPRAAVIINVGTAHLEGFGSREGIARAKSEIYDGLAADGTAIVNLDDDFTDLWLAKLAGRKLLTFSERQSADIYATDIASGDMPQYAFTLHIGAQVMPVQLQLLGRHQVMNALAAASLAHACGISLARIVDGLQKTRAFSGRTVPHSLGQQRYVIDDTYNANPSSMKAAIDLLAELPGRHVLVLGDMGELGGATASGHLEVGEYARMKNIDALYATGQHSAQYAAGFGPQAQLFPDHQALLKALEAELQGVVTILVKGSRSARMERVVQGLTGEAGAH
ncbi:MAG: UDP-N-acetylmuramoyl-tripeptide--D-alanyl-D-alanine ligase [Pseudomonadota bacterium]